MHIWFAYPAEVQIGNSASSSALGENLDIRGKGGYAIVPPSVHSSGSNYEWIDQDVPIAAAPEWLIRIVAKPLQGTGNVTSKTRPVDRTPARRGADMDPIPEGRRNSTLASIAGTYRRRGYTQEQILDALSLINDERCGHPLSERDIVGIARSVSRYPTGGGDPLECVWHLMQKERHSTTYSRFLSFASHLQRAFPGRPVALPIERIAELLDCHHTLISRFRRRAEEQGLIQLVHAYVRTKKRAAIYCVRPECTTDVSLSPPEDVSLPRSEGVSIPVSLSNYWSSETVSDLQKEKSSSEVNSTEFPFGVNLGKRN